MEVIEFDSYAALIEAAEKKGLIPKTINNTIIAYTSAIMEVKSSMGPIVAIPTAGSCGVVGGALFGSLQEREIDLKKMTMAFLAAGITGVFIAGKYTFAAEEGGCQVETGAGAAMAAAGLNHGYLASSLSSWARASVSSDSCWRTSSLLMSSV